MCDNDPDSRCVSLSAVKEELPDNDQDKGAEGAEKEGPERANEEAEMV